MVKMLTLFGVEDLRQLKYNDLKRELKAQRFIRMCLTSMVKMQRRNWKEPLTQLNQDKIALVDIYVEHLDALMTEIEYVMAHRAEPLSNHGNNHRRPKAQIRRENEAKRKAVIRENTLLYDWQKTIERDGMPISWDRDKFMLIAADRGYQTKEAIVQDVGKELNLDLARAKLIVEKGRFTWGQVLCLGAMLEMTPKEFCDTFLAGYFTEQHGEYRADYANICREELLKRAIKPQIVQSPTEKSEETAEVEETEVAENVEVIEEVEVVEEIEIIEVGADGRPLDEEEWFDN